MTKSNDKSDKSKSGSAHGAVDITDMTPNSPEHTTIPDTKYNVRDTFGLDIDWDRA